MAEPEVRSRSADLPRPETGPHVEIGVDSLAGARIAASAGAGRIELCSALAVGGLTPGTALIEHAVALGTPVHVLIRPRPGGFVYSRDEIAVMLRDIAIAHSLGAAGVVVGALDPDGELDTAACTAFVQAASGVQTTFHRAIDVGANSHRTLDSTIALGFTRVLTSGRRRCALDGAPTIRALHTHAAGAIEVMACGGIRASNAGQVLAATGVAHLHAAPLRPVSEPTAGGDVSFGPHHETDPAEVAALLAVVRGS